MKITILGQPASGKSQLAKAISERFGIPHIHIDRFWFTCGGGRNSALTPNIEAVRQCVREKALVALEQESWVSDGVYTRLQPEIAGRADVVIFLDIPLWRRLLNHASRMMRPATRHQEISLFDELLFFAEMIKRAFTKDSKLRALVEKYKDKAVVLSSHQEIDAYLKRYNGQKRST